MELKADIKGIDSPGVGYYNTNNLLNILEKNQHFRDGITFSRSIRFKYNSTAELKGTKPSHLGREDLL